MTIVWTGQPVPTPGMYVDAHGHRVVLRTGELAPICTFSGAAAIGWTLVQALPTLAPRS